MNDAFIDIEPGFDDPVHDAQRLFRGLLLAMSCPGTIVDLSPLPPAPASLDRALVALPLALADLDTPLWFDPGARKAGAHLRFHCGAPETPALKAAAFALFADAAELPDITAFNLGTHENPDTSTTVFVAVSALDERRGLQLCGPGIDGSRHLYAGSETPVLARLLPANHAHFPRGIDVVLCQGDRIAAVPRSTTVEV